MNRINVTRSSMPPFEEYVEMIRPLWSSRWLTNQGELHNKLEEELQKYLKVDNVSLFTNGHMALYNAIKALDLKGEVITTPYTFASTTHAIVQNGLVPVFCDIKEDDYTIDASKIEDLITDKTSAILAVHVYGNVCDVDKIAEIAKRHHLKVIYDAAHAFGVSYKGRSAVSFGDVAMMSFHATKVYHTIEGGALVYKDSSLRDKLVHLRNFGLISEEDCAYVGMNSKMNEFQAAMGLCNLKHIDEEIAKRKKVAERYRENLKDVKGIKIPQTKEGVTPNYIYFPIFVSKEEYGIDRDELQKRLKDQNIYSRKYFYPLTSDFTCYHDYNHGTTPIADYVSKNILTLPMYASLSLEEVDMICNIIKEVKR